MVVANEGNYQRYATQRAHAIRDDKCHPIIAPVCTDGRHEMHSNKDCVGNSQQKHNYIYDSARHRSHSFLVRYSGIEMDGGGGFYTPNTHF